MDPALQWTQVRAGPPRRSSAGNPDQVLPWSYRFFGSALVGRAPHQLPLGVRATLTWAAAEAHRHVRSGRTAPDQEEVLGLRLAYQALKAEAATVRVADDTMSKMLAPVIALRHRQRAAVLMRHGLKMSEGDVARVLGVRPTQVQPILACAAVAVARRLGRPVDLTRALRAAAKPAPDPAAADEPVAPVVRMQRSRSAQTPVQILIAPVQPATIESEPVAQAGDVPAERGAGSRSVWSLIGRVAAAATVGMLFAWAVWPVH
jgi:hypothetical protein